MQGELRCKHRSFYPSPLFLPSEKYGDCHRGSIPAREYHSHIHPRIQVKASFSNGHDQGSRTCPIRIVRDVHPAVNSLFISTTRCPVIGTGTSGDIVLISWSNTTTIPCLPSGGNTGSDRVYLQAHNCRHILSKQSSISTTRKSAVLVRL